MAHRIRYTMSQEPLSSKLTGVIEIDETYVGGKLRIGPVVTKPGVTNSKPIPHVPLPLKEVIADVLKVKPPEKPTKIRKK